MRSYESFNPRICAKSHAMRLFSGSPNVAGSSFFPARGIGPSVVVDNFHVERFTVSPHETDPPLLVDPDTMLTLPISFQRLQPVSRRHPQIVQAARLIEIQQFSPGRPLEQPKTRDVNVLKQRPGVPTAEAPNHRISLLRST